MDVTANLDFKQRAIDLIQNRDNRLPRSAYDIAWMARVRDDSGEYARYPDLVRWLVTNQYADGSWGGRMAYIHDRVLCTLAALMALKENGVDAEFPQFIERGERFIWQNLHKLHHEFADLAGFELLLPTLLQQASEMGIRVPAHTYGYGEIRDEKLKLIPLELLDSPKMWVSLANSMEYRMDKDVLCVMENIQGAHGAIANSPSTTAYLAMQSGNRNQQALAYLDFVHDRGVPGFYPWTDYEIAWMMQHLSYSGIPLEEFHNLDVWQTLLDDMTSKGIGIHQTFGIPDGDTTSVTMHVLLQAGFDVDPLILKTFEHPETRTFQTFFFERNMSVITNVHALEALALLPDYPAREIVWDAVIRSLLSLQKYHTFWIDKWHISPYYATGHTLMALLKLGELGLVEYSNSIDWLIHTQHANGGWGHFAYATAEETAYALLTLMTYHEMARPIDVDVIHHGMEFLYRYRDNPQPHPELFIAKTLYTPIDVVEALLMATFARYETLFISA